MSHFYTTIWFDKDILIDDIFNELSDEYLVNELQKRGYKIYEEGKEVILTEEQNEYIKKYDNINYHFDVDANDVLNEISSTEIEEYCKENGIEIEPEVNFEDPSDLGWAMSKLGPYEIAKMFASFKYHKYILDKNRLKEYLMDCIDSWLA